jgi:hypothetical protein
LRVRRSLTVAFVHAGRSSIPEGALLRDIIYVLQGIDGKHVRFQEAEDVSKPSKISNILSGQDSDDDEQVVDGRIAIVEDQVRQFTSPISGM